MSDNNTSATTETPAPTTTPDQPAASEPGGKPKPGSMELVREHARKAQAIVDRERAGIEATAPADGPAGRDPKTGKFLKGSKKPASEARTDAAPAAETQAAPEKEPPKVDESGQVPGSLARLRRLMSEGKMEEAFTQAFGKVPGELLNSKQWRAWQYQSKQAREGVVKREQEIQAKDQQLREIHQQLSTEFRPMIDARRAYQAGEYEDAFRLAFGEELTSFQRKALQRMANPGVGQDPAFAKMQAEIQALRKENQDYINAQKEAQEKQTSERRLREYWDGVWSAIEQSDNPQVAAAVKKSSFRNKVAEIQAQHYDSSTDSTMPPLEAAELALEALIEERREWEDVFGGGSSSASRERSAQPAIPPARAATPARPTARAVTTLSPRNAAEAAAEPKLKGKALMDKYVRLGNAMMAKANGIG